MNNYSYVQYEGECYIRIGISQNREKKLYFHIVSIKDFYEIIKFYGKSNIEGILYLHSMKVNMEDVIEITDSKKIESIKILYE